MLRWLQRVFTSKIPDDAGARGEQHAADWLQRTHGFTVVARNWRDPRDRRREIDLICRDGDVLVFIEVKARTGNRHGFPEEAVGPKKQDMLLQAADVYIEQTNWAGDCRFDIIAVSGASEKQEFYHIEDAFH